MPRNARENIETNYIHLIVQGINREYIFEKEEYKEEFIKIIGEKTKETEIEILAYCIMDNHAHLLIYYEELEKLSKIMQKINTTYAIRYNKANNRKGYVFRDRFYTQPILNEIQLYNCLVYIHQNPVKAGKCLRMQDYVYSSYNDYTKGKRLIGEKSIKLVFGSEEKYIKQFNVVHERVKEIEDIKDVIDYEYNIEDIIKKYVKRIEGKLEENEIEFGKLLLEIREKCGISLRKMSKIFNINKDKINKYIHKIIDNE